MGAAGGVGWIQDFVFTFAAARLALRFSSLPVTSSVTRLVVTRAAFATSARVAPSATSFLISASRFSRSCFFFAASSAWASWPAMRFRELVGTMLPFLVGLLADPLRRE